MRQDCAGRRKSCAAGRAPPWTKNRATAHPLAHHPRPPPPGEGLSLDDWAPMESCRHRDQMMVLIERSTRVETTLATSSWVANEAQRADAEAQRAEMLARRIAELGREERS